MRLWSLHPSYLDRVGLVACWREALLAKAVLAGRTRGYRHHPQLARFRDQTHPVRSINAYLLSLHAESVARGYRFQKSKCGRAFSRSRIPVTSGQLKFEMAHLERKVRARDRGWHSRLPLAPPITPNPVFCARPGPVESWERGA